MIRMAFKKGMVFLEGLQRWTLVRRLVTGKIQVENDSGEIRNLDQREINQLWLKNDWVIYEPSLGASSNVFYHATPRDLSTFSERNQEIAKIRQQYLSRLGQSGERFISTPSKLQPRLDQIAKELGHSIVPKAATVYQWHRRYAVTKCVTKLVDGRSRSGRLRNDPAYDVFEECINEVYLNVQKRPGSAVFDALVKKVERINLSRLPGDQVKLPGQATVYRWLSELEADLVATARLGQAESNRIFRRALKTLKVKKILDRWEIDHTPLDLLVIDLKTNLLRGRPWMTMMIDRASGMIVGFYICFHAPSAFSVMQCIKRAILPKDELLSKFPTIKGQWPARGIPTLIACDNGPDLHSSALETACLEMGIELLFCPAGSPQMKGAVERTFRTLEQELIHTLPGTTFSNVEQRGDYPSEKLACIDIDTLIELITKWIVEQHSPKPRGDWNIPPLAKWLEDEANTTIELPAYPEQLDVITGISTTRTVFHYGVELDHLYYNSHEMQSIKDREGGTPVVRLVYYEDDAGYVQVYDNFNEEYIKVPAIDIDYARGLTRQMHSEVRRATRQKYGASYSPEQMRQSKEEMRVIVEASAKAKKMADRKKAAVTLGIDSEKFFASQADSPIEFTQDNVVSNVLIDQASEDLPDFPTFDLREQRSL